MVDRSLEGSLERLDLKKFVPNSSTSQADIVYDNPS